MTGLEWHVTGVSARSSQNSSNSTSLPLLLLLLLRKQARQPLLFAAAFPAQADRDAMGWRRLLGPAWPLPLSNKHSLSPLWSPAAASRQWNLPDFAACLPATAREPVKLPHAGEDRQQGVGQLGTSCRDCWEEKEEKKKKKSKGCANSCGRG